MDKKIVVFAGNDCSKDKEKYYYSVAYKTGQLLAKAGFIVATGGGPGLMDQVSKGAYEAGGETIGICLHVAGRKQSQYLSKKYLYHSLNPRQEKLLSLGDGFLAVPGGIGTMYEIFAVLSLKRKLEISKDQPLIIIDGYFQEFRSLIEKMKKEGFVGEYIDSLFTQAETPEKAVQLLLTNFNEK